MIASDNINCTTKSVYCYPLIMVISRGNPVPHGSWIIIIAWKSRVAHHKLIFEVGNAPGPRCRATPSRAEGTQSCPVGS